MPIEVVAITPLVITVERLIKEHEQRRDSLMQEAELCDKRLNNLRLLLPAASDPILTCALREALEPLVQEVVVPPAPPPPPPIQRIQVTRDIVFRATQKFDKVFTVNDVVAAILEGTHAAEEEFKRVRSTVAQLMMSMLERGWVYRVEQGLGKRQAIWRRVPLTDSRPLPEWNKPAAKSAGIPLPELETTSKYVMATGT